MGQKGRTVDEAENLAIDVLSLLRYARLLEDRIMRSTAGYYFSYEMYHSQYLSKGLGRNRFINYARSIFNGSTERVFGQLSVMTFSQFDVNPALSAASFQFKAPAGADVSRQ